MSQGHQALNSNFTQVLHHCQCNTGSDQMKNTKTTLPKVLPYASTLHTIKLCSRFMTKTYLQRAIFQKVYLSISCVRFACYTRRAGCPSLVQWIYSRHFMGIGIILGAFRPFSFIWIPARKFGHFVFRITAMWVVERCRVIPGPFVNLSDPMDLLITTKQPKYQFLGQAVTMHNVLLPPELDGVE